MKGIKRIGTVKNDTLNGTTGNDELYGKSGNDWLYGKAGNDELYGGADNDYLNGGTGNDTIWGGVGHDFLVGGVGHDTLDGGAGHDSLYGGVGNDKFYGYAGNDYLFGGTGNDEFYGGTGNDLLDGGADNDTLYGRADNDLLYGGAGNDLLDGGAGNDTIWGGTGYDTYQKYTKFDLTVTDTQVVSAVETDTLNSIEVVNITAFSLKDYNIDASALTIRGELQGSTGNDQIQGGSGNDRLRGYHGSDTLIGNGGNDTLDGTIFGFSDPGDIDVLTSNNQVDRDLFLLGRTSVNNKVYYLDSGIAPNSGNASYARITDFDIIDSPGELASEVDRIQLWGVASDYRLGMTTVNGQTGVGIYKTEGSVSNLLDDDLIGLVQGNGVDLNTLNLTDNTQFVYVV